MILGQYLDEFLALYAHSVSILDDYTDLDFYMLRIGQDL